MNKEVNTPTGVLVTAGIILLACILLGLGAAAAGGAVYALTQGTEWLNLGTREDSTARPARSGADADELGIVVAAVVEGGPAAAAGVERDDILLELDGQAVDGYRNLRDAPDGLAFKDAIRAHQPGDQVTLTVRSPSEGDTRELRIDLGEHPDMEGVAYLGVTFARGWLPERPRLSPDLERFRDAIPEDLLQITVVEVDPESPAEEAGLRKGDVILSADGEPVTIPQDVIRVVTS